VDSRKKDLVSDLSVAAAFCDVTIVFGCKTFNFFGKNITWNENDKLALSNFHHFAKKFYRCRHMCADEAEEKAFQAMLETNNMRARMGSFSNDALVQKRISKGI
jgi:hypothetical protein